MASITEVSKLAGVSIATVSRVINGNPRVDPDIAKAVQQAISKLGYTPPENGKVGRPRRTPSGIRAGAVAILFPDQNRNALRTPLSGRLLHGIEEVLRERSLTMIVSSLDADGDLPQSLRDRQVDGVIVRSGWEKQPCFDAIRKIPHIWMFEQCKTPVDGDIILEDNIAIGVEAARYLIGKGHQQLAFVNLMPEHPSFRIREKSFLMEAEEAGKSVLRIVSSSNAKDAVSELLARKESPTGIFVPGGDDEVRDIYRAMKSAKLRIGSHVSLISCNNDPQRLSALDPALPNIDIQAEAIGRAAVETLLWRLRHPSEPQRKVMVAPSLGEPTAE